MNLKKMNIKNIDNKLYRMIAICTIIMIPIIIVIIIIAVIFGGKVSYEKLQDRMKDAAIAYTKDTKKLPLTDGGVIKISYEDLVKNKNIKSMKKMLGEKKADICEGFVTVRNNNNYYLYSPYLNCKDKYTTNTIYSKIIETNKIVDKGNGLYKNSNNYIFRGEFVNNYVEFANQTWRILGINDDNSIRMIQQRSEKETEWDNRYNITEKNNDGINDYLVSRIRDVVNETYNDKEIFTDNDKAYIISKDLCIGKRSETDTVNDGSIECSSKLDKQPLGLIQVNEYLAASIDPNCHMINDNSCKNYNYLVDIDRSFWSLTASIGNTNRVYKISGSPYSTYASNYAYANIVTNISGEAIYASGSGTIENPYKIR